MLDAIRFWVRHSRGVESGISLGERDRIFSQLSNRRDSDELAQLVGNISEIERWRAFKREAMDRGALGFSDWFERDCSVAAAYFVRFTDDDEPPVDAICSIVREMLVPTIMTTRGMTMVGHYHTDQGHTPYTARIRGYVDVREIIATLHLIFSFSTDGEEGPSYRSSWAIPISSLDDCSDDEDTVLAGFFTMVLDAVRETVTSILYGGAPLYRLVTRWSDDAYHRRVLTELARTLDFHNGGPPEATIDRARAEINRAVLYRVCRVLLRPWALSDDWPDSLESILTL